MTEAQQKALLQVGELCGLATRLDVKALQEYLDSNPTDFRYQVQCNRAIHFARAMQSELEKAQE